jgi:hypothetical protein
MSRLVFKEGKSNLAEPAGALVSPGRFAHCLNRREQ